MTKKQIAYMIFTAVWLSVMIVLISCAVSVQTKKNYYAQELMTEASVETQPVTGYYLKAYEGELAAFRGDSETPYKRLGISISVMSDYDKAALEKGIYAGDEQALKKLIEDYTS